jgi:hypothetical protein
MYGSQWTEFRTNEKKRLMITDHRSMPHAVLATIQSSEEAELILIFCEDEEERGSIFAAILIDDASIFHQ